VAKKHWREEGKKEEKEYLLKIKFQK